MLFEPTRRGVTCLCAGRAEFGTIREQDGPTKPLRVTHAPVNMAGIAYKNVEALKRRGVDARLVVFKPQPFRPTEFDWNLNRPDGFLRAQLTQWRALARLLPRTDVFHFYFGLTLVPRRLQFPILRRAAQAGRLPLRRLRHPRQDAGAARLRARGRRSRRRLVRRDPLGSRRRGDPARHRPAALRAFAGPRRRAPARRARALAQGEQGHRVRRGRMRRAARRPRRRPRPPARRGARALPPRGHRRRPAQRRLVRDLRDRGDGARQARRHLSARRGGSPHRGGVRHRRCRS